MIRSIIRFNKIAQVDMHKIDITMTMDDYLKQKNFLSFSLTITLYQWLHQFGLLVQI